MSSSETVTETLDEGGNGITDRVGSLSEALAPSLAHHAESGNLAVASGVVSLARAGRTFLKGNRKRGVLQALGGLFWVGVALAQRRSKESSSGSDLTEVADISPDVEEAVEPSGHDTDHATGEEVVDTTDADIEDSDTAPEVESDVDGDVDQRDVVESDDLENVESADDSEDATEADADDATQAEPDGGTETDEDDE